MKSKNLALASAAMQPSQEQPSFVDFTPMVEQQQQAKSGLVEAVNPGNTAIAAIAASDPLRATAASVVVQALRAVEPSLVAAMRVGQILSAANSEGRYVLIGETNNGPAAITAADNVAGTTISAVLTFDGGEKNGAPLSNTIANGVGLSTAINAAIAPTKPSFTSESILRKIEDIVLADGTKEALVIVDQFSETLTVITGDHSAIQSAMSTAAGVMQVTTEFSVDVQTTTTTAQFGE